MKEKYLIVALSLFSTFTYAKKEDLSKAVMEEVIVTATKRGPLAAQDLPTNISVISSESIGKINAAGIEEFSKYMAGVSVYSNDPGSVQINVRGLTSFIGAAQVGIYYDDIPAAGQGARFINQADMLLYDLEQVEFLRGPQGTLYGSGSQGGTLRYISAKPDLAERAASLQGDLSSHGRGGRGRAASGMVNVPIVEDVLGLRVVGSYQDRDGYVDRPELGRKNSNSELSKAARALLRWQPSDATRIDLANWYQMRSFDDVAEVTPSADIRQGVVSAPSQDTVRMHSISLEQDLEWANLSFSHSRYRRDFAKLVDFSYSPIFLGNPGANLRQRDTTVDSTELRLASSGASDLQGVVGLFYQRRQYDDRGGIYGYAMGETELSNASMLLSDRLIENEFSNKAIFGELSYAFNEQWELLAGLRSFRVNSNNQQTNLGTPMRPDSMVLPRQRASYSDTVFKLQANYDYSEDIHSYLVFSQGFREGGNNPQGLLSEAGTPVPGSYEPDFADNFEWGVKSRLMDGQLLLNSSLYLMLWEDSQTQLLDQTKRVVYTGNTEDVKLYGLELESHWQPDGIEGFSLHSNLAYNKQQLTNDTFFYAQLGLVGAGREGDNLPYTYRLSGGLVAEQHFSLDRFDASISVDVNYRGKANSGYSQRDPVRDRRIKAHALFGANFSLETEDWAVSLYAKNLFDKRAIVTWYALIGPMGSDWARATPSRTLGLKANYYF